jgi:hypothetical protein
MRTLSAPLTAAQGEGAEVTFEYRQQPVRVSYAVQRNYESNLRAIYLTLEGIRLAYARGLGDIFTSTVSQMLQLGAGATARDPYEVLGVRPDFPDEIIHAAWKVLAKKLHPDAGGSDDAMKELNDALDRIHRERGVT